MLTTLFGLKVVYLSRYSLVFEICRGNSSFPIMVAICLLSLSVHLNVKYLFLVKMCESTF